MSRCLPALRILLLFLCLSMAGGAVTAAPPAASRVDLTGSVSSAGDAPLAGATVRIYTAQPRVGNSPFCPSCFADCAKSQVTDAAGHFRIHALARSLVFRVLVVRDGYEPAFVSGVDPLRAPVRVTLKRLDAANAGGSRWVVGRVLDPFGQPVVGATVEPGGLKTAAGETFGDIAGLDTLAITNEEGEFRFRCPKARDVALATIKARGLAPSLAWLPAGSIQPNLVHLAQGVTVMGTVHTAQGRAMSGVVVEVVPTSTNCETFTGWQETATDGAGRFALPNVPAGSQYAVCLRMDSLAGAGLGAGRTVITAGRDGSVTPLLKLTARPAGVVSGRVLLMDGGAVPPATRVMLARDGTWDSQQKPLSADGSFVFRSVPPGEQMGVYVLVRGYHTAETATDYDRAQRCVWFKTAAAPTRKILSVTLTPDSK